MRHSAPFQCAENVSKITFVSNNDDGQGLVQAYLLVALLGFLLIRGARASDPRFWNRVGACVHLAILPAYIFHWDFLAEVAPAGAAMRNAIGIHLTLLTLECVAGFSRASDTG